MTDQVTDIPTYVDLDSFVDKDNTSSTDPVAPVTDPVPTLDLPHFTIAKSDFVKALKISNILSQGAGKDVITKALGIQCKKGKLNISLTNFEMCVSTDIEVLNTDNQLEDFFAVSLSIISVIILSSKSLLTIFKKDDGYYMKAFDDSDFYIETIRIPQEQLQIKDEKKYKQVGEVITKEFSDAVKGLLPIASASSTPNQRRVFIKGSDVIGIYVFCISKYKCSNVMPDFDMNVLCAKIVNILFGSTKSKTLKILKHKNKIMFKDNNFKFSFISSDHSPQHELLSNMGLVLESNPTIVDTKTFNTVLDISSKLEYTTSKMDFNFSDNGSIIGIVKTKRKDHTFNITKESDLKPMDKSVEIQSDILKCVMPIFNLDKGLSLSICDKGVGITNGKFDAVLYSSNIGVK